MTPENLPKPCLARPGRSSGPRYCLRHNVLEKPFAIGAPLPPFAIGGVEKPFAIGAPLPPFAIGVLEKPFAIGTPLPPFVIGAAEKPFAIGAPLPPFAIGTALTGRGQRCAALARARALDRACLPAADITNRGVSWTMEKTAFVNQEPLFTLLGRSDWRSRRWYDKAEGPSGAGNCLHELLPVFAVDGPNQQ